MGEWISEHGLRWRTLEPLGVEVEADLSLPLTTAQQEGLVGLLWRFSLILSRGQRLAMQCQRDICALVGPILLRGGETGIMNNEGSGYSASEFAWHADAAYTDAPFIALSLHALDVVDDASSTCFVATDSALESLPDDLRHKLEGARVEMISPHFDALGGRTCDTRDPVAMKRGVQPGIYHNPNSGRDGIWVSELQAARISGMEWEESRVLLNAVFDHLYKPEHILEHRWRTGDMIIWDNIALQHMRGSLKDCGTRILQRVIVGTEGVAPHIQETA